MIGEKKDRQPHGVQIPHERLRPEILRAVIEEFVLREGTNYGEREYSLEEKVLQVEQQLERGLVQLVYDEHDETCSIVPSRVLRQQREEDS